MLTDLNGLGGWRQDKTSGAIVIVACGGTQRGQGTGITCGGMRQVRTRQGQSSGVILWEMSAGSGCKGSGCKGSVRVSTHKGGEGEDNGDSDSVSAVASEELWGG